MYLDGLGVALDVGEEEVIETNLTTEQAGHVDLVRVEGAVQDLFVNMSGRQPTDASTAQHTSAVGMPKALAIDSYSCFTLVKSRTWRVGEPCESWQWNTMSKFSTGMASPWGTSGSGRSVFFFLSSLPMFALHRPHKKQRVSGAVCTCHAERMQRVHSAAAQPATAQHKLHR